MTGFFRWLFEVEPPDPARTPAVLVVETEPRLRRFLQVTLERAGYRVLLAEGGIEALNRIVDNRPDVVVMDRTLSDLDGREVLSALRRLPEVGETPVLMLLPQGDGARRSPAREARAPDACLIKPFNPMEMLLIVKRFLPEPPLREDEGRLWVGPL